ncbi:MAG: cell wall-binding repeat-containing protein [Erysipelotrichaceae bacterium]|nr:cell wall-binding repeat-containing protein [Erysipelotrichaceae bacterium]
MKNVKKILALVLAVSLSFSHILTTYADTLEQPQDSDSLIELEMEELDPTTLHVKKLGETEEQPDEEEELNLEFKTDDIVRVSIVLDKASTIDAGYSTEGIGTNKKAIAYRDQVKQQQRQVTKAIESKLNKTLDVKWNLTLAVNIISANVRYGDINKIKMIDGVKNVFLENRYEPSEDSVSDPQTANTSSGMVGATAAWAAGYTGAGSRIAIIDTGIDTAHQSFSADGFNYAINSLSSTPSLLTQTELNNLKNQLNSKSSNYVSSKIPYGYNYVDGNTTINHLSDTEGEHGSHVAGIAAANRFIRQGNSYVEAATSVFAVGMAPDAQLLIMKVFGSGGGAYDSDYFAALEDAIVLGADSANLSLGGGSPGFTFSDQYQEFLNSLSTNKNNKMVVSISAGNTGAITDEMKYGDDTGRDLYIDDVSMHTGGSPGTFINSMGTAAAQNIGTVGAPLTFNDSQSVYYTETDSTGAKMTTITGSYNFVYIDAIGEVSDYSTVNSAVSLNGKIVIVNRGDNTFVEKGNNAISYSPKALIVANNQKGSISMSLDDFTGTFPMVSITLTDAETIKENSTARTTGGITYYTGTVTVTSDTQSALIYDRKEAEITDFSSWGVPGSLLMKPEITAPGGDIYSVNGENNYNGTHGGGQDQYEFMSGTSMAAPHIAGLAAVVAQYVRENNLSEKNSGLTDKYSTRAIVQSLLMSTATPMRNDGEYVSILQQGSGLAEVHEAVSASSIIMISDEDKTLTAATGAAADGKVKVEFGDDPARDGYYEYTFTIYNITDKDLTFDLDTDIFTQGSYSYEGETYMDRATTSFNANVNYIWAPLGDEPVQGHDVDKDGDTDKADALALADYLSGKTDGSTLDLAAGEMDNDGKLTSYDMHLLLNWEPEEGTDVDSVVPANSSREVTVQITVNDPKIGDYPNGAYIEGFTYVVCTTIDSEGVNYSHSHSIPLLGFYGSWTDPSMFDNTSYVDVLYDIGRTPYTGHTDTNYISLTYNGASTIFTGNPYMVEDKFPADRLAVNSNSTFNRIAYNLYRSAGTTGYAVSRIDDYDGDITEVLSSTVIANEVQGIYYSQSSGSWQNLTTKMYSPGKKPSDYGLKEGDMFRIGFYAVPEYNAMMISDDMTDANAGILSSGGFRQVLLDNTLGRGAFIGYDFVVDNTDPIITSATLSGSTLTVSASDETNLAYVAVMSLDGNTVYAKSAPGEKTFTDSFNIQEAIANASGYIAVFVGDYAGNEAAAAIQVNNNGQSDPYSVSSVTITPASLDLYKGNTADLTAKVLPLTATDRTVTWTSNKTSVATVDSSGHVTAVGTGTATITATSNADSTKSATCSVNVVSVNKALNAIIWDEEGKVYFSSFNANSLPTWSKLHNDDKGKELMNAFMQSRSALYAGTLDTSSISTTIYSVNRSSYALTEYGENYVGAFGMARTSYSAYFVYGFAKYIIFGNLKPESDADLGGSYSGLPYGLLDISDTSGDGIYVCGICARSIGSTSSSYYFLDELGTIWQTTASISNSISFSTPTRVMDTGIATSFLYQSIYYDGTYIYWTHQDGDVDELIIINPSTKVVYHAGDFGENVWPVGGIYVNGSAAPASVEEETMDMDLDLQPLATRDELITDEFRARLAVEAEKFDKSVNAQEPVIDEIPEITTEEEIETVNEVTGSTESIRNYTPFIRKVTGSSSTSGDEATVTLSENAQTTNGIFTVSYDKDTFGTPTVTFTDAADVKSYNIDTENGVIRFVYAAKTPIPANTAIATVNFNVSCDDSSITVFTEQRNTQLSLNETNTVTLAGQGHDWNEPTYSWTDDYSSVTATRTCRHDVTHVETETVNTTSAVTKQPTCTEKGETTYTAVFTNSAFTKQTKTAANIDAIGHKWAFKNFSWNGNNEAEAVYYCLNNNRHEETVRAEITVTVEKDPLCDIDGSERHTATVSADASLDHEKHEEYRFVTIPKLGHNLEFVPEEPADCEKAGMEAHYICTRCGTSFRDADGTQSVMENELIIPATGHDWNEPEWQWTEDLTRATATFICKNNTEHTYVSEEVSAEITTVEPTAEEDGYRTYTVTVIGPDGETYQDSKTVPLPAHGYNFVFTEFIWSDDFTSAQALFTDEENNATRYKDAEVTVVITPATCEQDGKKEFTAYINKIMSYDGEEHSEKKETVIPATGHAWGKITYSWSDDYSQATATQPCNNDHSHDITETVNTTSEITLKPTCTEMGETTYTAAFTNKLFETQTITLKNVPATGHIEAEPIIENEKPATCTADGSYDEVVYCSVCGEELSRKTVTVPATGHKAGEAARENEKAATCTEKGSYDLVVRCTVCNEILSSEHVETEALGHDFGEWKVTKEPTCTQNGEESRICSRCGEKETRAVEALGHKPADAVKENNVEPTCEKEGGYDMVVYCSVCKEKLSSEHTTLQALGHSWGEWTFNGAEAKTHSCVCGNDPAHKETSSCQFDEGVTVGNTTTYTCSICHGTYCVTTEAVLVDGIIRVAGDNRYGTAMNVTDFFMEAKSIDKLSTMVIASGTNFADALAGSYLASVKDCPIMLIDDKHASEVEKYIAEVMDPKGKVYILGGEKAVSAAIEKAIKKSVANVERLAGDNRYLTNIEILKETGLNADKILVATGKDFADSLSASASGLPILLVKDALDSSQLSFLKSVKGKEIIILGGEKAVNAEIEKQLKQYGTVTRVAGANRFETSVKIAEKLFKAPKAAVLAFSNEFPDGLCGGPLGQLIEGPVILTRPDKAEIAREYLKKAGISDGVVLGGEARIDDETVRKLYGLKSSSVIELYHK